LFYALFCFIIISSRCKTSNLLAQFLRAQSCLNLASAELSVSIKHSCFVYTICPADNATAGSLGRRRAGQLRFGFVAVSAGHIV
jgi:hypothetical protein